MAEHGAGGNSMCWHELVATAVMTGDGQSATANPLRLTRTSAAGRRLTGHG